MEVRPPQRFVHPGQLDLDAGLVDPREERFPEEVETIHVNLGGCTVLKPPAWLWCVTYMLLARARSIPVKVHMPKNDRVRADLESVGLFGLLGREGVTVDRGDVAPGSSQKAALPVVRFRHEGRVHRLANRAYDEFAERGIGRPGAQRMVSEAFLEMGMNAVEHSQSPIGAFGVIRFNRLARPPGLTVAVADGGIGIRRSLEQRQGVDQPIQGDDEAIRAALKERVSGTGDPTRGLGLSWLLEQMAQPGHTFAVHSGHGQVQSSDTLEILETRETLFPGTLTYGTIPT